jgi:cyclase
VIPCLLLKNEGLVKTEGFKNPKYIGDPINAVKIFNDKEVDELIFLDIDATRKQKGPRYDLIAKITSECFMPLGYGGGITDIDEMQKLFETGVEKVVINSAAFKNPNLISEASNQFGNQSVVVSIDVKKNFWGKQKVYINGGRVNTKIDPVSYAQNMEAQGAGEIFLNSIDLDGKMCGYDVELIRRVSTAVSIPVVACGGAGKLSDFSDAVKMGRASAVAAGSMFVFHGKHRAVMINYPQYEKLKKLLLNNN